MQDPLEDVGRLPPLGGFGVAFAERAWAVKRLFLFTVIDLAMAYLCMQRCLEKVLRGLDSRDFGR